MLLLRFPARPANDNPPREVWTCRGCDSHHFILEYAEGSTKIRCGMCNSDVTEAILPTIPIGVDLCQQ